MSLKIICIRVTLKKRERKIVRESEIAARERERERERERKRKRDNKAKNFRF